MPRKYYVPFAYERYGRIEVEADNIKDAFKKAEEKLANMSLQEMEESAQYLSDSEEIDTDGLVYDENGNTVEE